MPRRVRPRLLLPGLLLAALACASPAAPDLCEPWQTMNLPITADGRLIFADTRAASITYPMNTALPELADVYTRSIKAQGWELTGREDDLDTIAISFHQANQHLGLWIADRGSGPTVSLSILKEDE